MKSGAYTREKGLLCIGFMLQSVVSSAASRVTRQYPHNSISVANSNLERIHRIQLENKCNEKFLQSFPGDFIEFQDTSSIRFDVLASGNASVQINQVDTRLNQTFFENDLNNTYYLDLDYKQGGIYNTDASWISLIYQRQIAKSDTREGYEVRIPFFPEDGEVLTISTGSKVGIRIKMTNLDGSQADILQVDTGMNNAANEDLSIREIEDSDGNPITMIGKICYMLVESPSLFPTSKPTKSPSIYPSIDATLIPSRVLSHTPTKFRTSKPTASSSPTQTLRPTEKPSFIQSNYPSTVIPSSIPTLLTEKSAYSSSSSKSLPILVGALSIVSTIAFLLAFLLMRRRRKRTICSRNETRQSQNNLAQSSQDFYDDGSSVNVSHIFYRDDVSSLPSNSLDSGSAIITCGNDHHFSSTNTIQDDNVDNKFLFMESENG